MDNNFFLKMIKDFITYHEGLCKNDNIESFVDLDNEELKELCVELEITRSYYINIVGLVSKKLEQTIDKKDINNDFDNVRNHSSVFQ